MLAELHLAATQKDPYDVAIIDHMMPDMDGLDLGRAISSDDILNTMRLILFTSMGDSRDYDAIRSAGFDGFLSKPIRQSRMYNCLRMVCNKRKGKHGAPAPAADLVTSSTIQSSEESGTRILLAEDNLVNQKVMLKILSKYGCCTDVVENGAMAVEQLRHNQYQIVLMDLQMPEMNGFEATGAIRNPENGCLDPDIPIIAVTANASEADRSRCRDAGMNDFMAKPVRPAALMEKISRWINASRPS